AMFQERLSGFLESPLGSQACTLFDKGKLHKPNFAAANEILKDIGVKVVSEEAYDWDADKKKSVYAPKFVLVNRLESRYPGYRLYDILDDGTSVDESTPPRFEEDFSEFDIFKREMEE
ncbi:hypothetical protein HK102_000985, partial [Quaeritorhiza haematococci]